MWPNVLMKPLQVQKFHDMHIVLMNCPLDYHKDPEDTKSAYITGMFHPPSNRSIESHKTPELVLNWSLLCWALKKSYLLSSVNHGKTLPGGGNKLNGRDSAVSWPCSWFLPQNKFLKRFMGLLCPNKLGCCIVLWFWLFHYFLLSVQVIIFMLSCFPIKKHLNLIEFNSY